MRFQLELLKPEMILDEAGVGSTLVMYGSARIPPPEAAETALEGAKDLPEDERKFPTFRMPIRDKQGEIVYWWFWDGQGLSYSVELDAIQDSLPLREVMSSARLLQELQAPA